MALFDNINSRYTKSMEHGGSYERDAAIGGYDRKELRGLSKQAKRGTLTQRERARYKYLKDERGGRRKRGLLSGLGGAAAALGGLAAAGKLGQGGDGNGVMEFFRNKLKGDKRQVNEMEPTGNIENPAQEVFEDVPERDEFGRTFAEQMREEGETYTQAQAEELAERQARLSRRPARGTDTRDFSGELSENVGEGTMNSLREHYNMMQADEAEKAAKDQELAKQFGINQTELPEGPVARGGMSPVIPSPDGSQPLADEAISDIIRQMRSDADEEEAAMSSNSPTNINEVTGMNSRSVDLGSDFPAKLPTEAEVALRGVPINFNTNRRPVESSNNQPPAVDPNDAITRIFQRTGQRPVRANSVDPMGIIQGDSRDENVSEAQREEDAVNFLITLNKRRVDKGLPEVNKITMDAIKETGRSTSELMTPRQFGQIPTNRPEKNLPQLEALQQLKSILGNRYN